jgi:hypothetical protein
MVEPISTGAALVGTAAWFANKLIGPSADRLGEAIRDYVNQRINSVFSRSEEIARLENVELKPVPPGFAMKVAQDISFSEDDMTEQWAFLLVNASNKFSSRFALLSDILSQIGPDEAKQLEKFFSCDFEFEKNFLPQDFDSQLLETILSETVGLDMHSRWQVLCDLKAIKYEHEGRHIDGWPFTISSVSEMGTFKGEASLIGRTCHGEGVSYDILERQRLIKRGRIVAKRGLRTFDVYFATPTSLGAEFVKSCRGVLK